MFSISFGEVAILLVGALIVFAPIALILTALLYRTRLMLNLELVDGNGAPAANVPIRGIRNRALAATSATGDGHLTDTQLYPHEERLGSSDEQGRFVRNYYLRNYHTLFVGQRMVFVDHIRTHMKADKPYRLDVSHGSAISPSGDPFDMTGGAFAKPPKR